MTFEVGAAGVLERHAHLLFDLDPEGRIVAVNEPEPDPAPRLWLGRARDGRLLLARHDVPTDVIARVADVVGALPAWDGTPLTTDWTDRLAGLAGGEVSGGPAFLFGEPVAVPPIDGLALVDGATRPLLERHFPYTAAHLAVRSPVVGVLRDGAFVAICMSCRDRPDAGEAGLYTVEAYRGQGFARPLVARWRAAMDGAGRTPFYSTTWDNAASLAVARGLTVELFAEELAIA